MEQNLQLVVAPIIQRLTCLDMLLRFSIANK